MRLKHRPDRFTWRENTIAFHRLADGATFSRLDPYAPGEQSWLLNSGRVIFVTAAEVRDIAKQVNDQDLPDTRPTGDWDEARIQAIEERLAALETSSNLVERESVAASLAPDSQEDAEDADSSSLQAELDEALSALAAEREKSAAALSRIAELEARGPEVRTVEVEKIVHVEVPVAAVEPETPEPYTPDFTLIPDALAKFAEEGETTAAFRSRLKGLWQRFGIDDGKNFPGGGEPLSGDEKITMREIDIILNSDEGRNASLLEWFRDDRPN